MRKLEGLMGQSHIKQQQSQLYKPRSAKPHLARRQWLARSQRWHRCSSCTHQAQQTMPSHSQPTIHSLPINHSQLTLMHIRGQSLQNWRPAHCYKMGKCLVYSKLQIRAGRMHRSHQWTMQRVLGHQQTLQRPLRHSSCQLGPHQDQLLQDRSRQDHQSKTVKTRAKG